MLQLGDQPVEYPLEIARFPILYEQCLFHINMGDHIDMVFCSTLTGVVSIFNHPLIHVKEQMHITKDTETLNKSYPKSK